MHFSLSYLVHCVSCALILTYFHSSGGGVICVYSSDKLVLEHFTRELGHFRVLRDFCWAIRTSASHFFEGDSS
jgi:hypothetical protein